MAWQDDLLDASIGGAPFFAQAVRSSFGRRTVVTEFPDRDDAAAEDLGRAARRFQVDGVVLGAEYIRARDAVVDVLESAGPHVFSHPWYGEVSVVLQQGSTIEVSESVTEGGGARITFSVVEVGDEEPLRIIASPAADLKATVVDVSAQAASDFAKVKSGAGVLAAIAAAISKVAAVMQKVKRKALGALGGVDALTYALLDLDDARDALAALPSALMSKINGLLAALAQIVRDSNADDVAEFPGGEKTVRVDAALQALAELTAVDVGTEPDDEDAAEAEQLFNVAFRAQTVAVYADLFLELPIESTDQAGEVVAAFGTGIEALLVDPVLSDELFAQISDLRAALDAALDAAAKNLPTISTYTPPGTLPALLIAYLVHGDPSRDLEVVARNRIADPNFIGGVELEVLVDG